MALEMMIPNPAIRNLIREGKTHQIYSQMQIGQGKYNMLTMNQSLASLVNQRKITLEDAMLKSADQEELRTILTNKSQGRVSRPRS